MTHKQNLARRRNYNKKRITGFHLDEGLLTEQEKKLFKEFKTLMLKNWDKGYTEFGLKSGKRYDVLTPSGNIIEHNVSYKYARWVETVSNNKKVRIK
jgi:hypothetical protein